MKKITMLVGLVFLLAQSLLLPGLAKADDTPLVETQTRSVATNLGLFGAHTVDIAADPTSDYIYIATMYTPNGFFRSADNGLTWRGLPKDADYGSGQAVEVNPANGHVYALLKSFIVSTDHGATFREVENLNGSSLLYAEGRLFVGTGKGEVKVSSDEGRNFSTSTVESGTVIRSLAASSDALYAISRNYDTNTFKVYKSTDWGSTWQDMNITAAGISQPEKVVVNPNTDHVFLLPTSSSSERAYRSINGGIAWTALSSDTPKSGNTSFDSTGRMYMGWKYSLDEGDTWTVIDTRSDYAHYIVADPSDYNILYDTSAPGFAISTDRGASWSDHTDGITGVIVSGVSQAKDKNIVWVATQNGLAKTTNFLSSQPDWQYPIFPTPEANFSSSGKDFVWVKPNDPNIVVVGTSASINYSTNAGTTWTAATVDIDMMGKVALQIVDIVSDGNGVLYAAVGPTTGDTTGGGVLKSTDFGKTWKSMGFPSDSATQSVAVAKNGDLYVGAGVKAHQIAASETIKGLYKYDKSADKWSKLDLPSYRYPSVLVDPEKSDTIYALAVKWPTNKRTGFYKSTDAGATWRHIASGLSDLIDYTAMTIQRTTSPNTLYLAAINKDYKGVIYKSSDAGESWGLFYTGLINEEFNALLFDGLLGGNDRGLYSLKSKAKVGAIASAKTVTKGEKVTISVTLKDAATKKKLSKRQIGLYKKVGKKWVKVTAKKTDKNAKAEFSVKPKKNSAYKVVFKPKKKSDKAEYAISKSGKIKIKVQK